MAVSPIAQVYGTIVMLEVPGVLLLLLTVATYLRHTRRPDGRWAGAVAALTLLLFFCKYNYGILWMIALGAAELSQHSPWRRSMIEGMRPSRLRSLRSRGWLLPLLAYMAFLAAIALIGGWTWSLAGREISVRSLGNPVLVLLWVLTAAFLFRPRRHLKRFLEIVRALPLLPRTLASTVFPIIWGWLLIPPHAKNFFYFVQNRSSLDQAPMTSILYYPHSFLRDYSPNPLVGALLLGAALLCALPIKRWRPEDRVLPLGLLTGFLLATFHTYKDPRFLFTVAPFVWLCAGAIGGALIEAIGRGGRHSWAAAGAAIMAMVLMGITAGNNAFDAEDFRHRRAELSAPAPVRRVVESIAAMAADSRGTLLAGTWNGLVLWSGNAASPIKRWELGRSTRRFH